MTIKELASLLAKKEGKKTQARIGEIRELLSLLSDLACADSNVLAALVINGQRRAKRKKK